MSHTENILGMLSDKIDQRNDLMITPPWVAKDMVNLLPEEVWNKNTTFLDPACKSGIFLHEIYLKLMETESLIKEFPDKAERRQHILHNQLFGIALNPMCQLTTARTVYGTIKGENNIKLIDNYITIVKNKDTKFFKEAIKEQFGEMKFDVIIGNPPYHEESGGRNATPLYNRFMSMGLKLSDINLWITPSRWFSGGIGLDNFRHEILSCNRIALIKNYKQAQKIFNGVDIAGGVCITSICKHSDTINFIDGETNNSIDVDSNFIKEKEMLLDRCEAYSIVDKTKSPKNLDSIVLPLNAFGLNANFQGSMISDEYNNIEVLGSYDNRTYISKDGLEKGVDIVNKYKIITGKVNPDRGGVNNSNSSNVINKPRILAPNQICTFSYLIVGATINEYCANALYKYIKTKFTRFLVLVTLASMNISARNFMFVPLQDFSEQSDINWSQSISNIDQLLYKKYNLSDEEIAYIEKTIKPMQ